MKKTILAISFLFLTATAFFAVPSYAQTTQEKADEINVAGQSAEQSQSATEARNTNDSAWSGTEQGGGTPDMEHAKTVDIISDNKGGIPQDVPSTFDEQNTEDVTPWKAELERIYCLFGVAMALCVAATTILFTLNKFMTPGQYVKCRIAQAMFSIAAATCAAAVVFSTMIMVKYEQYMMGGILAGAATLGLGVCIAMVIRTQILSAAADPDVASSMSEIFAKAARKMAIISACLVGAAGIAGGYATFNSIKTTDNVKAEYCEQHPESQTCTSAAHYARNFYLS